MTRTSLSLPAVLAAALVALSVLVLPGEVAAAPANPDLRFSRASAGDGAVTRSKALVRESIDQSGSTTTLDRRKVSLKVSQTTNLRGRQELDVSWSGAHPTGGLVGDLNSGAGVNEEYPFVLLQCRGTDSASVPLSKRLRPETCWTQTWAERFSGTNRTAYPAWRSDAFAPAAERRSLVNALTGANRPALCSRPALAERWVPMVSASGAVYPGGTVGCGGMSPESSNVGGSGLPSNATYGITGTNGKGSSQFAVFTADENSTLGCGPSVPCSLVAIPVMGISCDAYGTRLPEGDRPSADDAAEASSVCHAPDNFRPGQIATTGEAPNPASAGALWWAASNWRNRITVPLSFAQSASVCDVVSSVQPVSIFGSILLDDLTAQWQPKFCTDKSLKPFTHVEASDSLARNLLSSGSVDATFTSRAPDDGFAKPTVRAPVAVTGFAISYVVDGADGRPYGKLRLTPRLLAKLLSESYPGNSLIKNGYPALSGNPVNITKDPEFQALNPGVPEYTTQEAASTLLSLSSDADMVSALASYITTDHDARAWLDGTPDPWGMKVNPKYKGIALPVDSWPLLDDTLAPESYIQSGNNPCYTNSPSAYLGLIANPTASISTIILNMQYAISNVNINCSSTDPHDVSSLRLQIQGRQQPGFRFVLGIVPLSSVARYGLDSAALRAGPDGDGGTFVGGTDAGLREAAKLFKADQTAKTWTVDYDALRSSRGAAAYPGTIPVFTDVPTTGLSGSTAGRLAQFLRFAAGQGQTPGLANGQLPPGYLPLTKANGLGAFADYTRRAASAVEAQKGIVPPLVAADDASPGSNPANPSGPAGASGTGTGALGLTPPPVGAGAPGGGAVGAPPVATPPLSAVALHTRGQHSALGGYALPVLLVLGLLLGLVGLGLRYSATVEAVAGPAVRQVLARARR